MVVGKPVVVVVRRIVVVVVNCPSRCEIVVVTALRATVVVGNALPGFLVTVVTTNTVVVELTTVVDVLSTEAVGAGAEGTPAKDSGRAGRCRWQADRDQQRNSDLRGERARR